MDKNIESLEGDGFLFHLLHLLWVRDPVLGFVPNLNLPDTILFKYDQPSVWYFAKDKNLKRKSKSKLNVHEIQRVFLQHLPKSEIVAFYVSQYSEDEKKEKVIYEYLNVEEFNKFLFDKQAYPREGVLQRFIQPKSNHNFILRAIWGPTICLFEKIENLNNINDKKQDVYQRALTFEGENTPSRNVPIRGYLLPHKLENFVFNIAQHISNVTYDRLQVTRMVFNFKIDEHERIWFLFCSSLRLKNPSSVLHKYYGPSLEKAVYEPPDLKIRVPSNIETQKLSNPQPINLRKNYRCLNCENEIDVQGLFKIKYKDVIKGWEFDHYDQKEPWEVMKSLEDKNEKKITGEFKGIEKSIKVKGKTQGSNLVKNEILSKKAQANKKNTQFVYKSLFNEVERENPQNHGNFFSNEPNNELNLAHLIPIDKAYIIPPLIRLLHPHMREKEYKTLVKNPGFLEKIALVCEDCYLKIIGSSNANESLKQMTKKHILKNYEIVGKGKLNPEVTALRFELTRQKITSLSSAEIIEKSRLCKKHHGPEWCLTTEDENNLDDDNETAQEFPKARLTELKLNEFLGNDQDFPRMQTQTSNLHESLSQLDLDSLKRSKSSQFLNQMLNPRNDFKRKFLKHNTPKVEISSSVLKKTQKNAKFLIPTFSNEKTSPLVSNSEKEQHQQDSQKKFRIPKNNYLKNLAKYLNLSGGAFKLEENISNLNTVSQEQFRKLYESTKLKLKMG